MGVGGYHAFCALGVETLWSSYLGVMAFLLPWVVCEVCEVKCSKVWLLFSTLGSSLLNLALAGSTLSNQGMRPHKSQHQSMRVSRFETRV